MEKIRRRKLTPDEIKKYTIVGRQLKIILNELFEILDKNDQKKVIGKEVTGKDGWTIEDRWKGLTNSEKKKMLMEFFKIKLTKKGGDEK